MSKWKSIFLALALIAIAIGFSNLRPTPFILFSSPLGTIVLGLFFVAQPLEKESGLLDEQNRAAALPRYEPLRVAIPPRNSREMATHPVPTMAQIH
jgi:hypothetical protein